MLKLAVAVILCACAFAGPMNDPEWVSFIQEYGKMYSNPAEELSKYCQFLKNKQEIDQHNQEFNQGRHTYSKGINQFADLSPEEMDSYKGYLPPTAEEQQKKSRVPPVQPDRTVPNSINWVEKGAVTPVQKQGHCSSCWTFASTAAIEGRNFLATGKLIKLSEQNILDCATAKPTCSHGGHIEDGYKYVAKNKGLDTEQSYPYNNPPKANNQCKYKVQAKGGSATGYKHVHDSEEALKQAIAQGPVSVAVYAKSFHHYKSGVHKCPPAKKTDHAVTAVGYGTDPKHGDYWLVKNSWGTKWGEKGYIRVVRNGKNNNCLITKNVNYPTVSGQAASPQGSRVGGTFPARQNPVGGSVRPGCANTNKHCHFWAHIGECQKNRSWMGANCKVACRTC